MSHNCIDLCSSDYDSSSDKENASIVKRAKVVPLAESVNTACQFLPILDDRKCSPLKQELPFTIRYDALKAPSPFFTFQNLTDVTYNCDEIQTIQFCQSVGLIAKSVVCEIVVQLLQPARIKNIATNGGGGVIEILPARNLAKTFNALLRKAPFFINVTLAFIKFSGWFGIL